MSSGVGATVQFGAWGHVSTAMMIGAGGGWEKNVIEKPFLAEAFVRKEPEAQRSWREVVCRFCLDGFTMPPETEEDLTIIFPQRPGETAPAQIAGKAAVSAVEMPEMVAGTANEVTVTFTWNNAEPTFTPAS